MPDEEGGQFEQPDETSRGTKECPECGASFEDTFTGKMAWGRHRRKEHGVEGAGREKKARTRSAPASTKAPTRAQELRDAEAAVFATYTMMGQVIATRDPVCGG